MLLDICFKNHCTRAASQVGERLNIQDQEVSEFKNAKCCVIFKT